MTITNTCNPCQCLGGSTDPESFRAAVITLLCKLAGEGPSGIFYDFEILCDPTTDAPKIVRYKYTGGSTDVTAEAFNLDGTPYAGTISSLVQCSAKDSEIEILDDVVNGVATQFLRTYLKKPDGSLVRIIDTTLDGTTNYTVLGTVSKLTHVYQQALASTTMAMVDKQVDDSIIRFLRTYIKDSTGTITSTVDTNLDGITAYTPTGTVDVCTVDAILLETN